MPYFEVPVDLESTRTFEFQCDELTLHELDRLVLLLEGLRSRIVNGRLPLTGPDRRNSRENGLQLEFRIRVDRYLTDEPRRIAVELLAVLRPH